MLKAFAVSACALVAVLAVVRSVAPTVHQWYSQWGTIKERVGTFREMQRRLSIEELVAHPAGALLAATVCEDEPLRKRAEQNWVASGKDGPNGVGHVAAARVASEMMRAGAIDMRLTTILKMDCPKAIRLARQTVARN